MSQTDLSVNQEVSAFDQVPLRRNDALVYDRRNKTLSIYFKK